MTRVVLRENSQLEAARKSHVSFDRLLGHSIRHCRPGTNFRARLFSPRADQRRQSKRVPADDGHAVLRRCRRGACGARAGVWGSPREAGCRQQADRELSPGTGASGRRRSLRAQHQSTPALASDQGGGRSPACPQAGHRRVPDFQRRRSPPPACRAAMTERRARAAGPALRPTGRPWNSSIQCRASGKNMQSLADSPLDSAPRL